MTAESEALIAKGRRSLAAGRRLFQAGDYDFAASRAYYAMFYLAEALFLSKGLSFGKHAAVIAAFGQQFVKTGIFGAEHHGRSGRPLTRGTSGIMRTTCRSPRKPPGISSSVRMRS